MKIVFIKNDFFTVRDCLVSEWGPWEPCPDIEDLEEISSSCSKDKPVPEPVKTRRHRVVLHQPQNGGHPCPSLIQNKTCPQHKIILLTKKRKIFLFLFENFEKNL